MFLVWFDRITGTIAFLFGIAIVVAGFIVLALSVVQQWHLIWIPVIAGLFIIGGAVQIVGAINSIRRAGK